MMPIAHRAPNANPAQARSVVTKFNHRSNKKLKIEIPSNTSCTMPCNRDVHHQRMQSSNASPECRCAAETKKHADVYVKPYQSAAQQPSLKMLKIKRQHRIQSQPRS